MKYCINYTSSAFLLFKTRKRIPVEGIIKSTSKRPGKPKNRVQYKCADFQHVVSMSLKRSILLSISQQLNRFKRLFENEVY